MLPRPGVKDNDIILVTLGTHLRWARPQAIRLIRTSRRGCPIAAFTSAMANPDHSPILSSRTYRAWAMSPTRPHHRYDAAIIHGGTGITYACLENECPMLVWPHD